MQIGAESPRDWFYYTKDILELYKKEIPKEWKSNIKSLLFIIKDMAIQVQNIEEEQSNGNHMLPLPEGFPQIKNPQKRRKEALVILGVLAYGYYPDPKDGFPLPPVDEWTKDFCQALNSLEYCKEIQFTLWQVSANPITCFLDAQCMNYFPEVTKSPKVQNIYFHDDLPVSYVRFAGTVVLKNQDESAINDCKNTMLRGLGLLANFQNTLEVLKNSEEMPEFEKLKTITKMSVLQASVTMDGSKNRDDYEFDVINELLQNANDKVCDRTVNVTIDNEGLTLSYNESLGFLLRDFLAVSTLHNSGNKGISERANSTGHKGTGFKGVYKYFNKVVIQSNGFKCTFDDTKGSIKNESIPWNRNVTDIDYDALVNVLAERTKNQDNKSHYPIPMFKEQDPQKDDEKMTKIKLTFKNDESKESVQSVLGNVDLLQNSMKHLFLFNIDEFTINDNKWNRNDYIEHNFYIFEELIPLAILNSMIEKSKNKVPDHLQQYLENTNDIISKPKRTITVLFPKTLPENSIENNLFVGLPVAQNADFSGNFYVNSPLFDLQDNRKNLQDNSEWNGQVDLYTKLFILKIIEQLSMKHPDIAYRYFPYHYINNWAVFWRVKDREENITQEILLTKFICGVQSSNQTSDELYSIQDVIEGKIELLPAYAYKKMLNSQKYSQETPFIYYKDDGQFFEFLLGRQNSSGGKIFSQVSEEQEQPFYLWALQSLSIDTTKQVYTDTINEILRDNDRQELHLQGVYHIDSFTEHMKNFFGCISFSFEQNTYRGCFKNQRNSLYIHDKHLLSTQDPILVVVKKYSETLYRFQKELENANTRSLSDFIKERCVAVKTTADSYVILTENMYWTESDWLKRNNIFNCNCNDNINIEKLKDCCKPFDKRHKWTNEFFSDLTDYNEHTLKEGKVPKYSFEFDKFANLSVGLLERCESVIPQSKLDEQSQFPDFQGKTIKELLMGRTCVVNKSDGHNHRWTFGYEQGEGSDNLCLILFNEYSLPKLMKEFFDYDGFTMSNKFTSMKCRLPAMQFDSWTTLDVDNGVCPKDFIIKLDDKEFIKKCLVERYQCKKDEKWLNFKGYGVKQECPVCKANLPAQLSQLRIKSVRMTQSAWIPILCCINCSDAFNYTKEVYFYDDLERDLYEKEDLIKKIKTNEKIILRLVMFDFSTCDYSLDITPLHRMWMLEALKQD